MPLTLYRQNGTLIRDDEDRLVRHATCPCYHPCMGIGARRLQGKFTLKIRYVLEANPEVEACSNDIDGGVFDFNYINLHPQGHAGSFSTPEGGYPGARVIWPPSWGAPSGYVDPGSGIGVEWEQLRLSCGWYYFGELPNGMRYSFVLVPRKDNYYCDNAVCALAPYSMMLGNYYGQGTSLYGWDYGENAVNEHTNFWMLAPAGLSSLGMVWYPPDGFVAPGMLEQCLFARGNSFIVNGGSNVIGPLHYASSDEPIAFTIEGRYYVPQITVLGVAGLWADLWSQPAGNVVPESRENGCIWPGLPEGWETDLHWDFFGWWQDKYTPYHPLWRSPGYDPAVWPDYTVPASLTRGPWRPDHGFLLEVFEVADEE